MGQYHTLCRLDKRQHLENYTLGAGAKMLEQIGGSAMAGALALACATGFGTHARDLPWVAKGIWAGKPLASIGDYTEPTDLVDHPALTAGNTTEAEVRANPGTNIATRFLPALERAQNMRMVGTSWATTASPIGRLEDGSWGLVRGMAKHPLTDEEWEHHVSYLERVRERDMEHGDWARAPRPMAKAPDTIPAATEVGVGGAALWISIDAQEFVDTTRLGAQDLADVVASSRSTAFVQGALYHHARRGGGDLDNGHGLHAIGRWRGDRIALVGPKGIVVDGQRLTHAEIKARYTDLTDLALLMETVFDEGYTRDPNAAETPEAWFEAARSALLRPCVERWATEGGIEHPLLQHSQIRVYPAVTIRFQKTTYCIPASAMLEAPDSGMVWLDGGLRTQVKGALSNLEALKGSATTKRSQTRKADKPVEASWPAPITNGLIEGATAHSLLAAMADCA